MGETYSTYCSLRSGGVLLTYPLFSRGRQFLPTVMIRRDSFNIGEETLCPSTAYYSWVSDFMLFQKKPRSRGKKGCASKLLMTEATDMFNKWKERCFSSDQYIVSGHCSHTLLLSFFLSSLGLSYVNSLGASSFWGDW